MLGMQIIFPNIDTKPIKMKKIALLICLSNFMLLAAQNFQDDFRKHFQAGDTLQQSKTLTSWQKAKPNDPELYTSFYNYYFRKAKTEMLSLTNDAPQGESLVLKDSLDQTAGFIGSDIVYNERDLKNAFSKIDQGIALFPDRLDMRFGKIYGLGLISEWEPFTSEIIKAIDRSAVNGNEWTWTNNTTRDGGKDFFLSSLQNYQLQLYETERDDLLKNMQQIALAVLKHYPDNVESLSNLSVTYFLVGEYDKGLEPLFKAEKLDPKDYVVLSNIANGYKLKGNKAKAIEYYEKAALYGDESVKKFATEKIIELKK
jgi:tetratricopeptide (TPR) repeat protein